MPFRLPKPYLVKALTAREKDLLEELAHIRFLLKRWKKPEWTNNLHRSLRNEGEHIVMRTSNDFRKNVTKRTRKSKNDDWSARYVPSNNALHKRLSTSLLDQPIE